MCSVNFIRELIKERGWKNVRPCGDTRKVPDNYVTLRWLMVLRLAYFVLVHSIPHELCLNGDHTGIMFTLAKGKMWITKAMHESKDKSVNNHGEKRQFTVLATTSAAGQMLPHQVVVAGKTAGSLPKFGKFKISLNGMNTNKVPKIAVCFILTTLVQAVANIASFCTTYNHPGATTSRRRRTSRTLSCPTSRRRSRRCAPSTRAGASPSASSAAPKPTCPPCPTGRNTCGQG